MRTAAGPGASGGTHPARSAARTNRVFRWFSSGFGRVPGPANEILVFWHGPCYNPTPLPPRHAAAASPFETNPNTHMNRTALPLFGIAALACAVPSFADDAPDAGAAPQAVLASRDIGDPEANVWEEGGWPTTTGDFGPCDDRPDDPAAPKDHKALRLTVHYGAYAFGGWSANPKARTLPGKVVKITGWVRAANTNSWGMGLNMQDANTNNFSFNLPADGKTMAWVPFEFEIPETVNGKDPETGKQARVPIRFPIKVESISQHNWGDRNNPNKIDREIHIYDLRVHTDMSQIPVKDRPYEIGVSFPTIANCFYYGEEKPVIKLSIGSWLGEERTVRTTAEVESATGEKKTVKIPDVKVLDSAAITVDSPFQEPGAYTLRVKATGFEKPYECEHRYAIIKHPPELTEKQKDDSSYGINVHGGAYVGYDKFAKLGFVWVRDYAFNFLWMKRARGDGRYAGWPWYPKIINAAENVGMRTLPCLMNAAPCRAEDPDTPTDEWRRDMALIVSTFPNLTAFELDNEHGWPLDEKYGEYHRVFAEIMKACRPDALSVQEGCGGIHLSGARKHVLNGKFKDLKVLNGHRYAGMVGPEISRQNFNVADLVADEAKIYQRDLWRQWKLISELDGVKRQRWITEWGWDTRAGQIVSEWEQAAYMQREWVLALGNGIDKLFWYWYYDSDTPNPMNFFDGCGIFDRFREPKPVAPAFAALRTFLPADMEYLGYANFGPNHMAHLLKRADGKLVACAFQLYPPEKATMMKPEDRELVIKDPKAEKIYDMFGAELKRSDKRKLDIAPTWYVGLDPDCEWLKQCPMDFCFESPFFVRNVSGEPIPLHLLNFGKDGIEYRVELPKSMLDAGWVVEDRDYGYDVVGPLGAPREANQFRVVGKNGGVEKVMYVDIDIITQAYAKSNVEQFDRTFTVDVVNQSATNQVYELRGNLPEGWEVSPASQRTKELEPGEIQKLTFTLVKSAAIPATEKNAIPKLEILNVSNPKMEGMVIDYAPIVPRAWTLRRVAKGQIKIDGQPGEWAKDAAKYQLPNWMLGPRGDKETSRIYMAYDDDGLYMMFDLDDSQCKTSDPNSFWRAADCLEFQFGSNGDFTPDQKWSLDDHQFWFCPMPLENRVFAGFWGNCEGQSIMSDIKPEDGITSALSIVKDKAGDVTGYRMEIFISKDRLHGWNPKKGNFVKMMFTIAVQGLRDPREVYWPSPKRGDMAVKKPFMWSRVLLGD